MPAPTASFLSDLALAASAHVRAGRPATLADLVAGGASDRVLADTATRTVERLREAYALFGRRRLDIVLSALPQASLRAVLTRFDPHRPGVTRMRRAELLFLLVRLGEGGTLFPAPDHTEPLGAFRGFDFRAAAGF